MAEQAPNVIAEKQLLLEGFVSAPSTGVRRHIRMGILNALAAYDQLPLWYTLLQELGFSLVVAHGNPSGTAGIHDTAAGSSSAPTPGTPNAHDGILAGRDTIPSESVCHPAKQAHTRLYALIEAGATHVFFPQYDRIARCAVNCSYGCILEDYIPALQEGRVQWVSPLLVARRRKKLAQNDHDRKALFSNLRLLDPNHPVNQEEFDRAFAIALDVQAEFENALEQANAQAEAWAQQPGHHGIILAGRPYHADPALLRGLDREVAALGMSVLCGTHVAGPKPPDDGVPPWRATKHLVKLAHVVASSPHLDLVCLQAFGCGYDSLNMPEVKAVMGQLGKPFTALQLDDALNNAQSRIRLRTLAYTIRSGHQNAPAAFTPTTVEPIGPELLALARQGDPRAFNHLEKADVEAVFSGHPDLCYLAQALAGRAARLTATAAAEGAPLEHLAVPYVCKYCMLDALPRMVWRTLGFTPEVDWVDYRPEVTPRPNRNLRPVGVMGVAPLVYDAFLNDNLEEFLASLGCRAVIPDQEYLVDEDMSYPNARALFEAEGIQDVIYLNSYRCLKGHLDGHGALRRLKREQPSLRITVIDYDSEASALNRQNRIALAIHR